MSMGSQVLSGQHSNLSDLKAGSFPVSYRLRSYHLRRPADKQDALKSPAGAEEADVLENQQRAAEGERTQAVQTPEMALRTMNPKGLVKVDQRVPADSVAVHCGDGKVTVEVKQNFLGNNQLIHPSDLTLGGCAALEAADHILLFQTELQSCSSTMNLTEESLIYTFSLSYLPTPIGNTFILKTNPAEVVIECHYPRLHYVNSDALRSTWKPFESNILTENQLHFSLRLMSEDWQTDRASHVYINDMMHIEASVLQGHHIPLRVYVDSCVATADSNPNSQPKHRFIKNHGCLTDAKLTGDKSYFMPRSQEAKLRFQLKAFRFHQTHSNLLYITCLLKATVLSVPVDEQHKACSFLIEANRWVASGGDNKLCHCCETTCSNVKRKRRSVDSDLQFEGTAALGPVLLKDDRLHNEVLLPEPSYLMQTHEQSQAASFQSLALMCGAASALGVVLIFVGVRVLCTFHRAAGHYVAT
ncbi:zona pellucida sperm-binding protein 3-like [Thalassophryne amazonica]|uniref:zona pellucida sperm-binding protein 3-like n=1 Tax=Thalassophryne amazonica TaxID=390379 RepID=UPI001471AFDF|nr:zona pellucida sperm-binding protein 3-like [Thalassophryne amazonica]